MFNFIKITNLLSGLVLIRFSLSKLFSWPISVKAFVEMAKPLGIDPTFFRLFTGVIISTVCLGYLYSFYLFISKKVNANTKELIYASVINLAGILVMVGALISEFFLRVEPKWPLVIIALFIIITSILNLIKLKSVDNFESFKLFKKGSHA